MSMMAFISYLVEVSLTLVGLYLIYLLLLRQEQFFQFNRFYLLVAVGLSFLLPVLQFDFDYSAVVPEEVIVAGSTLQTIYGEWVMPEVDQESSLPVWFYILTGIYAVGVFGCYTRFGLMLSAIRKLVKDGETNRETSFVIVKSSTVHQPFSFLNFIFTNKQSADAEGFDQILAHEKIHIHERHSIDLIIVQLIAPLIWFHPLIWRLIHSIKANHEYIVDKAIIRQGYSLVEYQTLLLSQLVSNNSYGLVHNFNLSFIKKRITMMNTNKKSLWAYTKVTLAILSIAVFSAACVHGFGEHSEKFGHHLDPENGAICYLDGKEIDEKTGVSFNQISNPAFEGVLGYEFFGKTKDKISQNQKVKVQAYLVRGGRAMSRLEKQLDIKDSLKCKRLFDQSRSGDRIVMIFNKTEVSQDFVFSIAIN